MITFFLSFKGDKPNISSSISQILVPENKYHTSLYKIKEV